MKQADIDRFWSKIQCGPPTECWEWTAGKYLFGYGSFYVNGRSHAASRIAYELTHGSIDDGLFVRHKCDNPPCCNPNHLELGTHIDNMRDATVRRRRPSGTKNTAAKLNPKKVREAFELRALGIPNTRIANRLKVSDSQVWHILNGVHWRGIGRAEEDIW